MDENIITKELLLTAIVQDPNLQARNMLDKSTVEQYAAAYQAEAAMPPVRVAMVDGLHMLVDGWHRVAALRSLNCTSVQAEVTESKASEALLAAMTANLKHGLPLKPRERNNAIRKALSAYISARKHLMGKKHLKPLREIADDLGNHVSHSTIRNWLWKDHRKIAVRYGDGKPYENNGGSRPFKLSVLTPELVCRGSIDNVLAAYQGVIDSEAKGKLIGLMRETLERMEKGGNWRIETSEF